MLSHFRGQHACEVGGVNISSHIGGKSSLARYRSLSQDSQPTNTGAGREIEGCQSPVSSPYSVPPSLGREQVGGRGGPEGALPLASFHLFRESPPPRPPTLCTAALTPGAAHAPSSLIAAMDLAAHRAPVSRVALSSRQSTSRKVSAEATAESPRSGQRQTEISFYTFNSEITTKPAHCPDLLATLLSSPGARPPL